MCNDQFIPKTQNHDKKFQDSIAIGLTITFFSCSKKGNEQNNNGAQGIHFKIDGIQYDLTNQLIATASPTQPDSLNVNALDTSGNNYNPLYFLIIAKGGKTGIYTATDGCTFGFSSYGAASFYTGTSITYNPSNYALTAEGNEGNANIQGTFSGIILNKDNSLHKLTDGTFYIHQ